MPKLFTLNCPSCGGNVKIQEGTTKYVCAYCGNEHILSGIPEEKIEKFSNFRDIIPIPESVEFQDEMHYMRIDQKWFSWKYVPMAFFCVAWDAFLIFWYTMAFTSHATWIMIVFPIAHLAVGVGLTYSTLAGFFNKTVLELTPEMLTIWHEPLPWIGETRIATREIKQLYCTDMVSNNENGSSIHYNLVMVNSAGRARKIIKNLESKDVAIFIEQHIEKWLNIPDQSIPGELTRNNRLNKKRA